MSAVPLDNRTPAVTCNTATCQVASAVYLLVLEGEWGSELVNMGTVIIRVCAVILQGLL